MAGQGAPEEKSVLVGELAPVGGAAPSLPAWKPLDFRHLQEVAIEGENRGDPLAAGQRQKRTIRIGPVFVFEALEDGPGVVLALIANGLPHIGRILTELSADPYGDPRAQACLEERHGFREHDVEQDETPVRSASLLHGGCRCASRMRRLLLCRSGSAELPSPGFPTTYSRLRRQVR
jgi:hypothetical protein